MKTIMKLTLLVLGWLLLLCTMVEVEAIDAENETSISVPDPSTNCVALDASVTTVFALFSSSEFPCVSVPAVTHNTTQSDSDPVLARLTIVPNSTGRYELWRSPPKNSAFLEDVTVNTMAYAWSGRDRGLVLCVDPGTEILFVDYTEGASMSVDLEIVSDNKTCIPGILPPFSDDVVSPNGGTERESVVWSSARYFLRASHFEYTIAGQATETLAGSRNVEIDGDPGGNEYMTIEISWWKGIDETPKRFYGYFEANRTHWNMFEARVRNSETDGWESFQELSNVLSGKRGSCLEREEVTIVNSLGSVIRFEGLFLAVFLPWGEDPGHAVDSEPAILEARSSDNLCSQLAARPIVIHDQSEGSSNENAVVEEEFGEPMVESTIQATTSASSVPSSLAGSFCSCLSTAWVAFTLISF